MYSKINLAGWPNDPMLEDPHKPHFSKHSPNLCEGGPFFQRSACPRKRRCSLAASQIGSCRAVWRHWGRWDHQGTSCPGSSASSASAGSSGPGGAWDPKETNTEGNNDNNHKHQPWMWSFSHTHLCIIVRTFTTHCPAPNPNHHN